MTSSNTETDLGKLTVIPPVLPSIEVTNHVNTEVESTVELWWKHVQYVRFEVFTAVTMKNGVFWDVTPCGSCMNRRFGGT
jgi:hypothetical protein